jgi:single-strand DNA-binding protein
MAAMNKVILLGNLGQDPEIKALADGAKLATLSIATSESWKDKSTGERKEKTQWHRVVVWADGLVKVIEQYLAKGDQIMIVGQLETRSWEDQGGGKRYATEVVLRPFKSELQIIRCKAWDQSKGNRPADAGTPPPADGPQTSRRDELDDEIPF